MTDKMSGFEKELHAMFDDIWDCEIDHPLFQDTVGELMEAVIQAHEKHNLTLSTNLAEVGTDAVSRQAAMDALGEEPPVWYDGEDEIAERNQWKRDIEAIKQLPTIQFDNGLQKLADEIASFKRCFKSENSDYLTGYLSALSVVEGMIADMRGEQDGN